MLWNGPTAFAAATADADFLRMSTRGESTRGGGRGFQRTATSNRSRGGIGREGGEKYPRVQCVDKSIVRGVHAVLLKHPDCMINIAASLRPWDQHKTINNTKRANLVCRYMGLVKHELLSPSCLHIIDGQYY